MGFARFADSCSERLATIGSPTVDLHRLIPGLTTFAGTLRNVTSTCEGVEAIEQLFRGARALVEISFALAP